MNIVPTITLIPGEGQEYIPANIARTDDYFVYLKNTLTDELIGFVGISWFNENLNRDNLTLPWSDVK